MVTIRLSTETFRLSFFRRVRARLFDTRVTLSAAGFGLIAVASMAGFAATNAATRSAILTAVPRATCAHAFADDMVTDSTAGDQFPAENGTSGSGRWFYKPD